MARIVDETKLLRIKDAAVELVVKNGYRGASISAIRKKAGVAEGYLYRFYNSKEDLIIDLLYSHINTLIKKIETLLDTCTEVKKLIEQLFQEYFKIADTHPKKIKFMHVLMHDYNFQISDEQRQQIKNLSLKILLKGKENNEINSTITEEDIYLMIVVYPIEFINMRMKNYFGNDSWTNTDISKLTDFCTNALK